MTGEIMGVIVIFIGTIILAYPLGKYIPKPLKEKKFDD
jgi:hypothetical protein